VQDVAIGHIHAAERGDLGQRYILGNAEGNWTMQEAFAVLQEITGVPAPRIQIPYGVAWLAAYVDETKSKFTGRPPRAPLAGVRMALHKMFFSGQSHSRIGLAANSAKAGAGGCGEVVQGKWIRERISFKFQGAGNEKSTVTAFVPTVIFSLALPALRCIACTV